MNLMNWFCLIACALERMKDVNAAMALLETMTWERLWTGFEPTTFATWAIEAEYYVHWTYRAELTYDRSDVALIAQLVEHCTGNAEPENFFRSFFQ